jgi:hypothetical protein
VKIQSMTSLGDGAAGKNRASLSGLADDGGVAWRRYLVEGIGFSCLITPLDELEMCGCW